MGFSGLFKFAEPGRIEMHFLFVLLFSRLFNGSFFFLLKFEKIRILKMDR